MRKWLLFLIALTTASAGVGAELVNAVGDGKRQLRTVVSTGRLECRPTFENCGVYLNRLPGERGRKIRAAVKFRAVGSPVWRTGFDLMELPQEHAWRGSLFGLRENTGYELEIRLSGAADAVIAGKFRTFDSRVPVGRTVRFDPKKFSGGVKLADSGTPDGYLRYTAPPGAVLKAKSGGAVITVTGKYIMLENLTIDAGGSAAGIRLDGAEHVIIRNCEIYNFGRVGIRRSDLDGKFYIGKHAINYDAGIGVTRSRHVLVERCYIHHPAGRANTWFYSHPAGPCALLAGGGNANVVVRHNDFVGNDRGRFNDVIEGSGNGYMYGGFHRDADIYGNLLIFSNDDGAELEGGEMNVRFYENRVEGTLSGVSTGSCRLGPSYQFRNLQLRPGDEQGNRATPFKNSHGVPGYGTVFIFNNTLAKMHPSAVFSGFHTPPLSGDRAPALKAWSRNNIVESSGALYSKGWFDWKVDSGWDVADMRSPEAAAQAKALLGSRAATVHWTRPRYVNASGNDFTLIARTPGSGDAAPVPNFNFPNRGAWQPGDGNWWPRRPLPLFPDTGELYFPSAKSPPVRSFEVGVGGDNWNAPFKVCRNDDFFEVTPMRGIFRSGEKIKFTVTIKPEYMPLPRRCNGVLLLRTDTGLSLPITVYADFRDCPRRRAEVMKKATLLDLPDGRSFDGEVEIARDGVYWLFADTHELSRQVPVKVNFGGIDGGPRARLLPAPEPGGNVWQVLGGFTGIKFILRQGRHRLKFSFTGPGRIGRLLLTRSPDLFPR